MKRALVLPLAITLVIGAIPFAMAQGEDEEQRCIEPPDLNQTYEWAYNLSNGRTRYVEVLDQGPATTQRGHHNITKLGFEEIDANGDRKAWGRQVRFAADSPYTWGLATQDRWEKTEKGELRRMDSYDPPFDVIHHGQETCPGQYWDFTTHHRIAYGKYGQAGSEQANETWQVRALQWTNVTVPEGTHEVLPVTAVRESDYYRVTTYWSPEAEAPAKVSQGYARGPKADGTPEATRELTWYILDQRPTPIFEVTPLHPEVGDVITLNATASYDPEGNISQYRWLVNDEVHQGRIVELNATEEETLDIRLFVTDDANRTSTLGTTRYVSPEEGSGVGVSGPTRALEGQVVTLEAHPSFDPIKIRWRENNTVVGDGDTFQFYMEETRNLSVDAFHKSGRVYTTNHTVELVERESANGSSHQRASYPPGGSAELAILEPLEGQIVPKRFDVQVRAKADATLTADNRPVWQGTADPSESVSVTLDPGEHTLKLASGSANQTVNVTVAEDGTLSASDEAQTSGDGSRDADEPAPAPSPSAMLAAGLLALVAAMRRR